jgi:hypothetical protein
MVNSQKEPNISHLQQAAMQMAAFINTWRSEISDKKDLAPNIAPSELEAFLKKAEKCGIAATVAAYIVLGCEYFFRIRRISGVEIDQYLDDMLTRLEKVLTPLQAYLLVQLVEPIAKKRMSNMRIPIVYGPFSLSAYQPTILFATANLGDRQPPKILVPLRRGRLPRMGPIVAGVWIDTLAEGEGGLGVNLCRILLRRKILTHEFEAWVSKIGSMLSNLTRRSFTDGWLEKWPLEELMKQCRLNPSVAFERIGDWRIFEALYSINWRRRSSAK